MKHFGRPVGRPFLCIRRVGTTSALPSRTRTSTASPLRISRPLPSSSTCTFTWTERRPIAATFALATSRSRHEAGASSLTFMARSVSTPVNAPPRPQWLHNGNAGRHGGHGVHALAYRNRTARDGVHQKAKIPGSSRQDTASPYRNGIHEVFTYDPPFQAIRLGGAKSRGHALSGCGRGVAYKSTS